jgi:diguanylate cyclase (GGDEF)-like protein
MIQKELIGRLQTMATEMNRLVQLARTRAEMRKKKRALLERGGAEMDMSDVNLELLSTLASHSMTALKNAILYEETRQQVIADELTKLYNFRYFHRRLLEEWKRAQRHHFPVGVVMADLDNFKRINDVYGHAVGNTVLSAVADAIQKSVREIDVVARYGGEEFALILPQTPRGGIGVVAERIRKSVEAVSVRSKKGPVRVTISIGYDCWPGKAKGPTALVFRADRALSRAKRAGRNRVFSAPS